MYEQWCKAAAAVISLDDFKEAYHLSKVRMERRKDMDAVTRSGTLWTLKRQMVADWGKYYESSYDNQISDLDAMAFARWILCKKHDKYEDKPENEPWQWKVQMLAKSAQEAHKGLRNRWSDVQVELWRIDDRFTEWEASLLGTSQKMLYFVTDRCNVMELKRNDVYVLNTFNQATEHLNGDFFRRAATDPLQSIEITLTHVLPDKVDSLDNRSIRTLTGVHFDQALMHLRILSCAVVSLAYLKSPLIQVGSSSE